MIMMMVVVGVAEGEREGEGERVRKKARRGCRKRNDRWQLIQGQLDEVGWRNSLISFWHLALSR